MMLSLSLTTGYAILALSCVPEPNNEPRQVDEIAACTGIARPYLAKIIHALGEAGLVITRRGNRGGVRLSRPSHAITVLEIIEAVDGPDAFDGCLLGLTVCADDRACPTHSFWKPMRESIQAHLSKMTLAEVAEFEKSRGSGYLRDPLRVCCP